MGHGKAMDFRAAAAIFSVGLGNTLLWFFLSQGSLAWAIGSSSMAAILLARYFRRRPPLGTCGILLAASIFQATISFGCSTARFFFFLPIAGPGFFLELTVLAVQALLAVATLMRVSEMAEVVGRPDRFGHIPDPLPHPKRANFQPMVSIHLACAQEPPEVVIASLDSLARLRYPHFEVLVVDNNTLDPSVWRPVEEHCRALGPRFRFHSLGAWPGQKGGALNFALTRSDPAAELIGVVDADWLVEPDWLERMVPHFSDPEVGYVQGAHGFRDGHSSAFKRMVFDECSVPCRVTMVQRNRDNSALLMGAMALMSRRALEEAGGWSESALSEDVELAVRILNQGKKSVFLSEQVGGRGLLPCDFPSYVRQRQRWSYGAIQLFKRHTGLLFGRKGSLTRPQRYHLLKDWLRLVGLALYPILVAMAIAGAALMLKNPELSRYFPASFLASALLLGIVHMANLLWVCDLRLKVGKRRLVLMALADLSLTHPIGKAVWQSLLNRPLGFYRTDRYKSRRSHWESLAFVGGPLVFALVLLGLSAASLLAFGALGFKTWLVAAGLALVSLPYCSAVSANAISHFSRERLR